MQVSNSLTGFQAENDQTPSGMVEEQAHVVCKLFTHWTSPTLMRFQGTLFSEFYSYKRWLFLAVQTILFLKCVCAC